MRWNFRRNEMICRNHVSIHIAYHKAFGQYHHRAFHKRYREPSSQSEKPPPARATAQVDDPSIPEAADYSLSRETGHFFCSSEQFPRCRSPPNSIQSVPAVYKFVWKGLSHMNTDVIVHVATLLEDYRKRDRQISLLHYEMRHCAHISSKEMINSMSLGHRDSVGDRGKGHISNKKMYIALNYQEQMERMNAEAVGEIAQRLLKLEGEPDRLRYYVSLLEKREAEAIRLIYFEGYNQDDAAKKLGVVPRTLRRIKNRAVDKLAEMYEFLGHPGKE